MRAFALITAWGMVVAGLIVPWLPWWEGEQFTLHRIGWRITFGVGLIILILLKPEWFSRDKS